MQPDVHQEWEMKWGFMCTMHVKQRLYSDMITRGKQITMFRGTSKSSTVSCTLKLKIFQGHQPWQDKVSTPAFSVEEKVTSIREILAPGINITPGIQHFWLRMSYGSHSARIVYALV